MAINQLTTANTFQQWLTATQSLISTANTLTDGNGASFIANTILDVSGTGSQLNVRNNAGINTLYANNILISSNIDDLMVNGSATIANTLSVTGNTTLSNSTITYGNFETANITTFVGVSNTAIYTRIESAEASALAFSIALG